VSMTPSWGLEPPLQDPPLQDPPLEPQP